MPDAPIVTWAEALRVLLAPIVIVSAIGGMLWGLQRGYSGIVEVLRALNARRREGEDVQLALRLSLLSARLNALAIAALYLAAVLLLLAACALGTAFLNIAPTQTALLSQCGLTLFCGGALVMALALVALLRDVPLPLQALEEEMKVFCDD